jgi:cysteine desulfurase/selenocysteine lyase
MDDDAEVEHYKVQRESTRAFHIATIEVRQGNASRFVSHNLNFGGQLTRNNIHSYLSGRAEWLEEMPPYQGGGDMIRSVTFKKTTFSSLPYKFEAGTPNIAGAIGLAAAVDYLSHLGMENIAAHEKSLLEYATTRLLELEGLSIIGTAKHKAAVISFLFGDVHPHDIGTILDQEGIAVRTGHHCAQPVMDFFSIPATARASFGLYNSTGDID